MKKMKYLYALSCLCIVLAGCGGIKGDGKAASAKADYSFPQSYEATSASGKVKFACKPEVGEGVRANRIKSLSVKGPCMVDREKAWSLLGEGKEVAEKHEEDGEYPATFYVFSDRGGLYTERNITYTTGNNQYYAAIGANNPDNMDAFAKEELAFKSSQDCIGEVKKLAEELGYPAEELAFAAYPLDFKDLQRLEEEYVEGELLKKEEKKSSWTEEDSAYVIYAYQRKGGLPIFTEPMGLNRSMAYDTPDNAPLQALYSARGIEALVINDIYELQEGEELSLKPFEDIAAVVEEKFDSVLNDAEYKVVRAKLYQRVFFDLKQKLVTEPIWYFEVVENDSSKSVTLVNAATGKEIYMK